MLVKLSSLTPGLSYCAGVPTWRQHCDSDGTLEWGREWILSFDVAHRDDIEFANVDDTEDAIVAYLLANEPLRIALLSGLLQEAIVDV